MGHLTAPPLTAVFRVAPEMALCVLSCLFFLSRRILMAGQAALACLATKGLAPVRDLSVSKLVPGTGARAAVQAARSWREQLAKRWPGLEAGSGMALQSRGSW